MPALSSKCRYSGFCRVLHDTPFGMSFPSMIRVQAPLCMCICIKRADNHHHQDFAITLRNLLTHFALSEHVSPNATQH